MPPCSSAPCCWVPRPARTLIRSPICADRRRRSRAPQWRRLIFANSAADRRLYETAVLATLREKLRGSNIWVGISDGATTTHSCPWVDRRR